MDWKYAMLFALLLAVPAFASGIGPGAGAQEKAGAAVPGAAVPGPHGQAARAIQLGPAMDNAACKAGFTIGVLESMMAEVEGAGYLQAEVNALKSDLAVMQGYAEAKDSRAFWGHLNGQYARNMKDANYAILQARVQLNISLQERQALGAHYDALRLEYRSCNDDSARRFGQAREESYEDTLATADERISRLSAKGVETSGLSEVVAQARLRVLQPLGDAVNRARTQREVGDALKETCLFNGCPEGHNFNFAAKFESKKLFAILWVIKEDAIEAGLGDEVASAEADIASAEAILEELGGGPLDPDTREQLWSHINSAASTIKDIMYQMRSSHANAQP